MHKYGMLCMICSAIKQTIIFSHRAAMPANFFVKTTIGAQPSLDVGTNLKKIQENRYTRANMPSRAEI